MCTKSRQTFHNNDTLMYIRMCVYIYIYYIIHTRTHGNLCCLCSPNHVKLTLIYIYNIHGNRSGICTPNHVKLSPAVLSTMSTPTHMHIREIMYRIHESNNNILIKHIHICVYMYIYIYIHTLDIPVAHVQNFTRKIRAFMQPTILDSEIPAKILEIYSTLRHQDVDTVVSILTEDVVIEADGPCPEALGCVFMSVCLSVYISICLSVSVQMRACRQGFWGNCFELYVHKVQDFVPNCGSHTHKYARTYT
jgi:hypothetical protein